MKGRSDDRDPRRPVGSRSSAIRVRGGSRRRGLLALGALALSAAILTSRAAPAGSIAEQRQRLPPAAPRDACADPASGVWRSHVYYPRQRDWYIFTLTIRRDGDKLAGTIDLRGWAGAPTDPNPQPCRPGHDDYTVNQPAVGTVKGLDIDFRGTSWSYGPAACGKGSGGYILDRFIGTIDPALQEFQSVNRYPLDGQMVEDVTVFRRIQCFDPPPPAETAPPASPPALPASSPPVVTPPGLGPTDAEPRVRFGCGC